jgi:short-subunit dehydrogenase
MTIRDRVVLITGASSGIGATTARELAGRGAIVILAARRRDLIDALAVEIIAAGGRAHAIALDVTNADDAARAIADIERTEGRLDVLINNAGIGSVHTIFSTDAEILAQMDVNYFAAARLMRLALPAMLARGSGHIINIGSVAGEIGSRGFYSGTKFALRGLHDAVRRELFGRGVHFTLVEPGFIATPLTSQRTAKMPGPEIVADAIARAIERPRRKIVVPGHYRVAMLLAALLPGVADRLLRGTDSLGRARSGPADG